MTTGWFEALKQEAERLALSMPEELREQVPVLKEVLLSEHRRDHGADPAGRQYLYHYRGYSGYVAAGFRRTGAPLSAAGRPQ